MLDGNGRQPSLGELTALNCYKLVKAGTFYLLNLVFMSIMKRIVLCNNSGYLQALPPLSDCTAKNTIW